MSICSKDLLDGVIVLLTRKEVLWQESRAKEGNLIIELLTTEIIPMTSIVINCAGDNELARKINDYLKAKITQSDDTIYISLSEDELEIDLEKLRISKANVRKLLKDFIKYSLAPVISAQWFLGNSCRSKFIPPVAFVQGSCFKICDHNVIAPVLDPVCKTLDRYII